MAAKPMCKRPCELWEGGQPHWQTRASWTVLSTLWLTTVECVRKGIAICAGDSFGKLSRLWSAAHPCWNQPEHSAGTQPLFHVLVSCSSKAKEDTCKVLKYRQCSLLLSRLKGSFFTRGQWYSEFSPCPSLNLIEQRLAVELSSSLSTNRAADRSAAAAET